MGRGGRWSEMFGACFKLLLRSRTEAPVTGAKQSRSRSTRCVLSVSLFRSFHWLQIS